MQLQFSGPLRPDCVWELLAAVLTLFSRHEIIMEWNPEKLLLKIFTLGQTAARAVRGGLIIHTQIQRAASNKANAIVHG